MASKSENIIFKMISSVQKFKIFDINSTQQKDAKYHLVRSSAIKKKKIQKHFTTPSFPPFSTPSVIFIPPFYCCLQSFLE